MINILALVEDDRSASCRFRIRQFVEPLAAEGIVLRVRGLGRDRSRRRRLLREAAEFSAVILHRKLLRGGDFRRLRNAARRLIYDFDDAVMFRDSNSSRQLSRQRLNRFRRLVSGADLVMAGNYYLKDQADAAGGRAVIFPTVVDTCSFPPRPAAGGAAVIGWIGSASNFVYLSELLAPLRSLLKSRPGLVFRVVADLPPDLGGLPVDYRPWSQETETAELYGFSAGVMPLFDDPWTRGKCAFKLLQYGAASLASVASPVGANRTVIREGVTGYFAGTAEEWRKRIEELLDLPGKREEMGRAARKLVEENYSLLGAVPRLVRIIRQVV